MMIGDTDMHTGVVYRNTFPKMAVDIKVGQTPWTKAIMEVLNTTDVLSMGFLNLCLGHFRLGKGCIII